MPRSSQEDETKSYSEKKVAFGLLSMRRNGPVRDERLSLSLVRHFTMSERAMYFTFIDVEMVVVS